MELIEVYGEDGKKVGKCVQRGSSDEVYLPNEHNAVSIIFIENSKGEFLIQKASKDKGGLYSSTGGHIDKGEDEYIALLREVKEELGIDIKNEKIVSLGYRLLDFPVRFLYYLKKDIDIKNIHVNDEVEYVEYKSINEINDLIYSCMMNKGHSLMFREIMKYRFGYTTFNDVYLKYKNNYKVEWERENVNIFNLYFDDYKICVSTESIHIYKKIKNNWYLKNNHYNLLNNDYSIDYFNDLCDKIDYIIKTYEKR